MAPYFGMAVDIRDHLPFGFNSLTLTNIWAPDCGTVSCNCLPNVMFWVFPKVDWLSLPILKLVQNTRLATSRCATARLRSLRSKRPNRM